MESKGQGDAMTEREGKGVCVGERGRREGADSRKGETENRNKMRRFMHMFKGVCV